MRSYLNFTALVALFAIAGWWFATHPPLPRIPEAAPASPNPATIVDAGAPRGGDASR
ncbi:MAG TPA: hypothetical protein VF881_10740 [Polyangiaceae bacterium]